MTPTDKAALNRALQQLLHGPDKARAQQLAAMVRENGWEAAAKFSVSVCQSDALRLRPWDVCPCDADPNANNPPGRFLAKMIAKGLSRFEPDPLQALEEARPVSAGDNRDAVGAG